MSKTQRNTILAATVLTLMFATASESRAQFSGNQFGLRLPSVSARGIAQRILSQQDLGQRTYGEPTYPQPRCNQPVYPQPVYSQPVYSQPVYAQPVVRAQPQPVRTPTPVEVARQYTADARALFQQGQYPEAANKLNEVVKRVPKDSNAYQFRALAHFAKSDFENAAADAYDAMSLGNSWTPDVVKSIYGAERLGVYRNHMGQLKRVVELKPTMQSHFLLAYYHLVNGSWSDGKTELEKVLELQPEEPLSKKLLAAVNAKLAADEKTVASNTN